METVTIRLRDQFSMPPVCCACGAPRGTASLMISRSSLREARFLNLAFPLCDRCARLSSIVVRRRRMTALAGLGLSLLFCVFAFGLSQVFGVAAGDPLDDLIGVLAVVGFVALAGTLVAQWLVSVVGLAPETRRAHRLVSKAVRVMRYDPDSLGGGYVTFAFGNADFAEQFQRMNTGVVLPGRGG